MAKNISKCFGDGFNNIGKHKRGARDKATIYYFRQISDPSLLNHVHVFFPKLTLQKAADTR